MSMLLSQSRFRARVSCARPPVPIHVTKTSSSTDRHAQARLKGRLASLRRPLDCKNLTFLSTGAGGQHDREGQSWSSTASARLAQAASPRSPQCEPGPRQSGRFGKAALSSESERSRSGPSHSRQSVAIGSDPSPATPDSATARSAEEATVHFPAPGTPRRRF